MEKVGVTEVGRPIIVLDIYSILCELLNNAVTVRLEMSHHYSNYSVVKTGGGSPTARASAITAFAWHETLLDAFLPVAI